MKIFKGVLLIGCLIAGCERRAADIYPEVTPMPPELAQKCEYLAIGERAIDAQKPGYKAANPDERLIAEPREDKVDVYYQLPQADVGGSGHAIIDPATCKVIKVFFDE
ncbi:MAG: hypothetical protein QM667_13855 [Asticcacaulis sp.]